MARKGGIEVAMDTIKDDIAKAIAKALGRRLRIATLIHDAKVSLAVPESFFYAHMWPELTKVTAPIHQHRHKGSWALPTFEHTVVFELTSIEPLVHLFGDIWGPRKWCPVESSNHNDDPERGELDGGLSKLCASDFHPLFLSVRNSH